MLDNQIVKSKWISIDQNFSIKYAEYKDEVIINLMNI